VKSNRFKIPIMYIYTLTRSVKTNVNEAKLMAWPTTDFCNLVCNCCILNILMLLTGAVQTYII
jgi:hypothetical protein